MNSLTKKLAAGVIAAATMFSIAGLGATTANAANASDGSIEVSSSNAEFKGKTVTAYQMFTYDKEAVENGTATNSGYALISSWDDSSCILCRLKAQLRRTFLKRLTITLPV